MNSHIGILKVVSAQLTEARKGGLKGLMTPWEDIVGYEHCEKVIDLCSMLTTVLSDNIEPMISDDDLVSLEEVVRLHTTIANSLRVISDNESGCLSPNSGLSFAQAAEQWMKFDQEVAAFQLNLLILAQQLDSDSHFF